MITIRPTCCYLQLDLIWKSKRPFWIWSRISNFNVSWSNIRLAVILSADRSDPRSQAWTWQYFVITLPSPAVIRSAGVSVSVSVQFQSHLQSQFQFQLQFQLQSQFQFQFQFQFRFQLQFGFSFSFSSVSISVSVSASVSVQFQFSFSFNRRFSFNFNFNLGLIYRSTRLPNPTTNQAFTECQLSKMWTVSHPTSKDLLIYFEVQNFKVTKV